MGFAILHIEKGTTGKGQGLGNHIDRTKNVPNADPDKRRLNLFVHRGLKGCFKVSNEPNPISLQDRINARIKEGYKGKTVIRKDAVTHLNIVLTGSHDEMMDIVQDADKYKIWLSVNYLWARETYGEDNIVEFALHRDERTPHIHLVVVPLTADGRLSAKEVMGNRLKMSATQDSYALAMMKQFGNKLGRGIKGSTATHDSIKEFYARINDLQSNNLDTKNAQLLEENRKLRKKKLARIDELESEITDLKSVIAKLKEDDKRFRL